MKMKNKFSWLFILTIALNLSLSGQENIRSFTLDNGMKFIVWEDHSIPNADFHLYFKVGSRNEYPGITGLSHFFEHMMFNGAKKYGPFEFDRTMEANGGSNNAYTNNDLTAYTDWFPKEALELIFDLEADRLAHLALDSNMIESERGVVLSERMTGLENNRFGELSNQVYSSAFFAHPYRWPVIGYESDIKNWTQNDLKQFFKIYYAPNNCVAVICGDVEYEQVFELAHTYMGQLPKGPEPRQIHTMEPPQNGEKRVNLYADIPSPYIMIAHHVPEAGHEDYFALKILSQVLTNGKSSRLYRQLIDGNEWAVTQFAYYSTRFDPTLFFIGAIGNPEKELSGLEVAIITVLEDIANEGITQNELDKAKNGIRMSFVREMETIYGKSAVLAEAELYFGGYANLDNLISSFDKVTLEDVKSVAARYFVDTNQTVGILQSKKE